MGGEFAFALKYALVSLLVPPFGFVMLAFAGLLVQPSRPVLGRLLLWVALLGLLALATPAISGRLIEALERDLPVRPPEADPPRAIVVLGAEVVLANGEPAPARVGRLSLERLQTAAALQRRTHLPILVSGGSGQADVPPVAALMAESLRQDFQVPVQWVEGRSRDTWENASDSAEILRSQGIRSVYVVTHAWHMKRALMAFAPTGLVTTAAPTPLDPAVELGWGDLLPRTSTWNQAFHALHEWIGIAWYSLR